MDKFDFMDMVKVILGEAENGGEIVQRREEMKRIIDKLADQELTYENLGIR